MLVLVDGSTAVPVKGPVLVLVSGSAAVPVKGPVLVLANGSAPDPVERPASDKILCNGPGAGGPAAVNDLPNASNASE